MGGKSQIKAGLEFLIFHQPKARKKATAVARAEALNLLAHMRPEVGIGGPYGDPVGLFYLCLTAVRLDEARQLFPHLGYTARIERVRSRDAAEEEDAVDARTVKWKGGYYFIKTIFEADKDEIRDAAPDKREFILPKSDGSLRRVVGYRGDGGELSRRALPVIDCRLLVNLVYRPKLAAFLDPFAGAGGVIIEARRIGFDAFSTDRDPIVMHGLRLHGAIHTVADARALPFRDASMAAVASEPPYNESATPVVVAAISEIDRVAMKGASICLLAAEHQHQHLLEAAQRVGWCPKLDAKVDRKGTDMRVMAWDRG